MSKQLYIIREAVHTDSDDNHGLHGSASTVLTATRLSYGKW